jgi:hypothetical protein
MPLVAKAGATLSRMISDCASAAPLAASTSAPASLESFSMPSSLSFAASYCHVKRPALALSNANKR